ncbi:MAG: DUF1295 domain-containing protein [Clostridia bacterium]|nr:DUF1295 domain-containing protein [Clostridia bacterium]
MNLFFILFGLALIFSALGFLKFVYFISVGYGFSIAAMGLALLVAGHGHAMAPAILLMFYGLRLGGYLAMRELKSENYRKLLAREIRDGSDMKLIAKLGTWVGCALLYTLMVSPVTFRVLTLPEADGFRIFGVFVMCCGLTLEALADAQKTAAKRKNPRRFVDTGLYAFVRCPNYLGEILFWTGVLVSGIPALTDAGRVAAALAGWLCIVYIMFGGARRLELRHERNYGADPEYRAWAEKTPILLPFIPLYSVKDHKWLVG